MGRPISKKKKSVGFEFQNIMRIIKIEKIYGLYVDWE